MKQGRGRGARRRWWVVVEEDNGSALDGSTARAITEGSRHGNQEVSDDLFHLLASHIDVHLFVRREKAHHLGKT
jgi:hypothetical protein